MATASTTVSGQPASLRPVQAVVTSSSYPLSLHF